MDFEVKKGQPVARRVVQLEDLCEILSQRQESREQNLLEKISSHEKKTANFAGDLNIFEAKIKILKRGLLRKIYTYQKTSFTLGFFSKFKIEKHGIRIYITPPQRPELLRIWNQKVNQFKRENL